MWALLCERLQQQGILKYTVHYACGQSKLFLMQCLRQIIMPDLFSARFAGTDGRSAYMRCIFLNRSYSDDVYRLPEPDIFPHIIHIHCSLWKHLESGCCFPVFYMAGFQEDSDCCIPDCFVFREFYRQIYEALFHQPDQAFQKHIALRWNALQ